MTYARPDRRETLTGAPVALVAIDLRGTLIKTPRVTHLIPELTTWGAPDRLARWAQDEFDKRLRGPLQKRGDVIDWTRLAARSMVAMLAKCGVTPLDAEAVAADFQIRYIHEARPLVERGVLQAAAKSMGTRCVIVADGPLAREQAALATCFGKPSWMPPILSSECLGVNKLTSEFFVRLSAKLDVVPGATLVVGDRWDKDVAIPQRAGCRGILVSAESARGSVTPSLPDVLQQLDRIWDR